MLILKPKFVFSFKDMLWAFEAGKNDAWTMNFVDEIRKLEKERLKELKK